MLGRTHALIGAALPVGALITGTSPTHTAVLAAVSAGFSLGPDIDHPGSTISGALPGAFHETASGASTLARRLTGTWADHRAWAKRRAAHPNADPNHRSLTHTAISTIGIGLAAYAVALLPLGAATIAGMSLLVCRALVPGRWRAFLLGVAVGIWFITWQNPTDPELIGVYAAAGWLSHILADACTTMGVPLLWPMTIRRRRWWHVRLLGGWLSAGERKEMWPAIGVAAAMNAPYLWIV